MPHTNTETSDRRFETLDTWSAAAIVGGAVEMQVGALRAIAPATEALAAAIEAMAAVLAGGGRMIYCGAGSSGLIAQLDAIELPGTFGIDLDRVPVILAGGTAALQEIPSGAEDDREAAAAAVDRLGVGPEDGFVAVAASGRTPFTVAALDRARDRGAVTVGIACVRETPLLEASHHAVLLETPPEILAGSTRMGAGTAQKCALNILSTGVGVRLGHAYAGLMVNMRPENAKLRERAVAIVGKAAAVDATRAARALAESGWSIKTAIVACAAGVDPAMARVRLEETGGHIGPALNRNAAA
jgi:N-acetylmuramic acid 6-phosphate etherase